MVFNRNGLAVSSGIYRYARAEALNIIHFGSGHRGANRLERPVVGSGVGIRPRRAVYVKKNRFEAFIYNSLGPCAGATGGSSQDEAQGYPYVSFAAPGGSVLH